MFRLIKLTKKDTNLNISFSYKKQFHCLLFLILSTKVFLEKSLELFKTQKGGIEAFPIWVSLIICFQSTNLT
jgi:hypothetical protein